jgi:4-hydroxythreonine-4-phosphate dehydrogenase
MGVRLALSNVKHPNDSAAPGTIAVIGAGTNAPPYRPGVLDFEAARCAVVWFEAAVAAAMAGEVAGVVTCPIHKEGIHGAGSTYAGHTDMLAALTGARDYRMCLFAGNIRVVHISGHHSMRDALDLVRRERIVNSLRMGHEALVRLGLPRKRIAVAGLNPHAGEAGAFGREEIDEIRPAVLQCREEGIDCEGPISPDAVFRQHVDGEFDMVIAMYHDQGHIPIKLIAMDDGVNVTLGPPIVRTSVDHGTAYDIAGTGVAREQSLRAAIQLAAELSGARGTEEYVHS